MQGVVPMTRRPNNRRFSRAAVCQAIFLISTLMMLPSPVLGQPAESEQAKQLTAQARKAVDEGDISAAEAFVRRALSIQEQAGENQDVAQSLNTLAQLYQIQGRFSDAEPLFQ